MTNEQRNGTHRLGVKEQRAGGGGGSPTLVNEASDVQVAREAEQLTRRGGAHS